MRLAVWLLSPLICVWPAAAQPAAPELPYGARSLAATAAATGGGALCRAAIAQAEREGGLPPRLLQAIGRVESGRRDAATGQYAPWPWTINAEGRGSFFPDKAAAIAAVRALQAEGVRSIDVGCMQVNLRHHPGAFASLEAAFDPLTNARYAARFLQSLQADSGEWMQAAGGYHSQTPDRAAAYRARVAAAWVGERAAPAPSALPGQPLPTGGGGQLLSNGAEQMSPPPITPGLAGRGLDAYRAMPIALASRPPLGGAVRRF